MFVNVYVNYPLDKKLIYFLDESEINNDISFLFKRVIVDFNNQKVLGIIVDEHVSCPKNIKDKVKKIIKVLDSFPVIDQNQMEIANWIKNNYFCSIEEALFLFIPKAIKKIEVDIKKYSVNFDDKNYIDNSFKDKSIKQINYEDNIKLTEEQSRILEKIIESIDKNQFTPFLLHGITGSGKTEVYFKVINYLIKKDYQTVLLIPEISLTPQMINFFYKRLGDIVAVIHSKLKPGEKLYFYEKIKNNKAKVIIGPRSVLFSPFLNLRGIIIDEEHDDSYKSNTKPRFSTRNLAYFIAKKYNTVLIFGSATPTLETYFSAQKGFLHYLHLTKRYNNIPLPEIEIVDLRNEKKFGDYYLTEKLVNNIRETLQNGEQVILFINRRGFSSIVVCKNCGKPVICENCSIPLTYHKKNEKLICHYCAFEKEHLEVCPYCGEKGLDYSGIGTEKVEELIKKIFKDYVVERFDRDSIKSSQNFKDIIERFYEKKINILVGTQMISKGHHFPSVGLVGIINADIYLNFPDFRANEKTFQLIVQVSGRSGRGLKRGKVLIQTLRPEHYAISYSKNHDYEKFFKQELKLRAALKYPPFSRILRIVVRSPNKEKAFKLIQKIAIFILKITNNKIVEENIGKTKFLNIVGPAIAPIEKIDKNYRYHIFIKSNDVENLKKIGALLYNEFKNQEDLFIEIDLDPVNML
jgi:primosomal protein N' (replication factor Y)